MKTKQLLAHLVEIQALALKYRLEDKLDDALTDGERETIPRDIHRLARIGSEAGREAAKIKAGAWAKARRTLENRP